MQQLLALNHRGDLRVQLVSLEAQGAGPLVAAISAADLGPYVSLRLGLDRHGLTLDGDLIPTMALLGVGATGTLRFGALGRREQAEREARRAMEEEAPEAPDAPAEEPE